MSKVKLFMHIELEIDGNGTYNEIREAALKADILDVETGLVDENNEIFALEKGVANSGLRGLFIDILKKGV